MLLLLMVVLLAAALLLCEHETLAVDHAKFRTCSQTGFCRRRRSAQAKRENAVDRLLGCEWTAVGELPGRHAVAVRRFEQDAAAAMSNLWPQPRPAQATGQGARA